MAWITQISEYKRQVAKLPCKVEGCDNRRYKGLPWCHKHKMANCSYGHPLACNISSTLYVTEREAIERLFEKNPNHKGITYGVQWFEQFMQKAVNGWDIRGRGLGKIVAGILANEKPQAQPREIIKEFGALSLIYYQNDRRRLIKNQTHLKSLIASRIFTLCKWPKEYSKDKVRLRNSYKIFQILGEYVWSHIGPLLFNIAKGADAMIKAEYEAKELMLSEFDTKADHGQGIFPDS